jgi:hypothetical protein
LHSALGVHTYRQWLEHGCVVMAEQMGDCLALANQVVNWLAHYVTNGMGKVIEGATASVLHTLWSTIKIKLISPAAKEVLQDFEQRPDDIDNQAALRKQIKKAIESDFDFAAQISDLITKATTQSNHIVIGHSNLLLGGQGGHAPSAGGGGGGAMGRNVTGGRGGPGGHSFLYGQPGAAPGAGGGGAGALGEGVAAGDGGGGGERVVGVFRAEDLPSSVRIKVGGAGRGGEEGEDGEDGEDTSFGDLLHAQGGMGGRAGRVRPTARQVTHLDLEDGLRVILLSLAECVHLRNGLLYLLSAGWEFFEVPRLPKNLRWPLACTIHAGSLDQNTQLALSAVVADPSGKVVTKEEFLIDNEAASIVPIRHIVVGLRFTASCPGVWTILIVSGDIELARVPIELRISE